MERAMACDLTTSMGRCPHLWLKITRIMTILIFGLLVLAPAYSMSDPLVGRDDAIALVERLTNETEIIYDSILAKKPYDPSLMTWGMHYLARACLAMFNVTGDRKWLDKAINLTDYFALYSDVNGDGEPSWGSYNETWGIPRWEFKEYTVWDGVIALPMIEVVKLIKFTDLSSDVNLSTKADSYTDIARKVVERHYPFWTQVHPDQGYYWDDPSEDVGPYVNGFAALGRVELVLADVTGNTSYHDRPGQMANYILAKMHYDETDDLYTWDYKIGTTPIEDISHGAIDLEFLLMANERGLVDDGDILRICNTYQKRIWQVPDLPQSGYPLSMRLDGSGDQDYTALSRGWILLSSYLPSIYDQQRIALGIYHERYGLYPAGFVVLAVAQIPLLSRRLESRGIDPGQFATIGLDQLSGMLEYAYLRLNESANLGANPSIARSMLQEASNYVKEESLCNASVPIALIWEAWDMMGMALETGERLRDLESGIIEAEEMGAEVNDLKGNLSQIKSDFSKSDAAFDPIDARIEELSTDLERAIAEALIRVAEEVIKKAREMGIDTSRHEIFLQRAHEEFDKGNYGPAKQFTEYPLRLKEQIREFPLFFPVLLILVSCLGFWLKRRTAFTAFILMS